MRRGLACLFPLPDWGSFLSLFFQIDFQFLAPPFLLLALWHRCDMNVGPLEVVPEAAYTTLIFLDSFFFF